MDDTFDIGPIDEALDDYFSISGEALHCPDRSVLETYVQRIGADHLRGVYDVSGKLVGGLGCYRMGQWFGGNEIAAGGVSGVAINPESRGSGACRMLMEDLIRELHREKTPLASLFPATQGLYRRVGFQQAGVWCNYSLKMSSLRNLGRELPIHRFETPPIDVLNKVARVRAANNNGLIERTDGLWKRMIKPYFCPGTTSYVIGDLAAPEGYAIFKFGERSAGHGQPLVATDLAAITPRALRRLVTLIYDHRSMNGSISWYGSPSDPLLYLADEQGMNADDYVYWMLRVVDVPLALAGRGYPPDFQGQLHFEIHDPIVDANSGRWVLEIKGDSALVHSGGEGHLKLDVMDLAALFSRQQSATQLATLGKIEGHNAAQLSLADAAFAGPMPWVVEIF